MNATQCIVSIGELADRHRLPLPEIERTARELTIAPPFRINGVVYFAEDDAERIAQSLYHPENRGQQSHH